MKRGAIQRAMWGFSGYLFLLALRVPAQEAEKPAHPTRLMLLKGRLSAVFPAGARLEGRGHDIMAADESVEEESRVVVDSGKQRFVIMCQELFQDGGPDFAQRRSPLLYGSVR